MSIKQKAPREDRMMKVFLRNPDGEIEGVWAEQVSQDTAIMQTPPSRELFGEN
jgi:hypothetical protein